MESGCFGFVWVLWFGLVTDRTFFWEKGKHEKKIMPPKKNGTLWLVLLWLGALLLCLGAAHWIAFFAFRELLGALGLRRGFAQGLLSRCI